MNDCCKENRIRTIISNIEGETLRQADTDGVIQRKQEMTELEKLCEQALYEEIQDLGDGKSIVRDVTESPSSGMYRRGDCSSGKS